jgi:hypothetical protein
MGLEGVSGFSILTARRLCFLLLAHCGWLFGAGWPCATRCGGFVHNFASSLSFWLYVYVYAVLYTQEQVNKHRGTFSFSFSSFNDPWGFYHSHLLADPFSYRYLVNQSLPSLDERRLRRGRWDNRTLAWYKTRMRISVEDWWQGSPGDGIEEMCCTDG